MYYPLTDLNLFHNQPIFHPWQVQSTTTSAPTIPTISNTPVSSQQLDSRQLLPLDTTTPTFTQTDNNPLHGMCPTSIFNEVHGFKKVLNAIS